MEIVISKMTFVTFSLVKLRTAPLSREEIENLKMFISFHNSHLATNCKIGHEEMLADSINEKFAFI